MFDFVKNLLKSNPAALLGSFKDSRIKLEDSKRSLLLKPNEKIIYGNFSVYLEERKVGRYVSGGSSVRIMKGVWLRASEGKYVSHSELAEIDSGSLFITSERLVFNGQFKNYAYTKNKIISVEPFKDAIRVGIQNRQKALTFLTDRPLLLGTAIYLLTGNEILKEDAKKQVINELKLNIISKLKAIEHYSHFNEKTFPENYEIFNLLNYCILSDINDYELAGCGLPKEIYRLKISLSKLTSLFKELSGIVKNFYEKNPKGSDEQLTSFIKSKLSQKNYDGEIIVRTIKEFYQSLSDLGLATFKLKSI